MVLPVYLHTQAGAHLDDVAPGLAVGLAAEIVVGFAPGMAPGPPVAAGLAPSLSLWHLNSRPPLQQETIHSVKT
jgi:hypothetical protein